MSDKTTSLFSTIPVELIYRILHHLDDLTILCSIQNISLRMNEILNTYHRYQVRLRMSVSTFGVVKTYLLSEPFFYEKNQITDTLDLTHKPLNDQAVQRLAAALQFNRVLYSYLFILLFNDYFIQTFTTITLVNTGIIDQGAQHLGTALQQNQVKPILPTTLLNQQWVMRWHRHWPA